MCLDKLGYSYDVVENGCEALLALAERDYDLVLLDCMMPIIGGFEAVGIIRDPESKVRNHAIPVIALTGRASSDILDRCLAAGMNDYLEKPYNICGLKTILAKWLPGSSLNDGNESTDQTGIQAQLTADKAVLSLFVAKAPEYVAILQNSVKDRDSSGARFYAHKLAGAAAAIGASAVAGLAAEMEEFCICNEMSKAEQKQQQLLVAFDNLMTTLAENV